MKKTLHIWLTAWPIVHRGLHDHTAGRAENNAAFCTAAITQNYAIECDIQLAKDGEAMVFHDFTLEPLGGFYERRTQKLTFARYPGYNSEARRLP